MIKAVDAKKTGINRSILDNNYMNYNLLDNNNNYNYNLLDILSCQILYIIDVD